jgi:hypothetical protein
MSTATARGPAVHRGGIMPDWANRRCPEYAAAPRALFVAQRETYPNVAVARDVCYDSDPLSTFDIFAPHPRSERPLSAP